MARILNTHITALNQSMELINKITNDQYKRVVNSPYTRFLKGTPVPVTIYHQNTIESTTDVGFENVNTNIGISGKKFNKIKNIPLYGVDKSSFSLDDSEIGIKGEYHSEANLPMDCLRPFPEDYIIFSYGDTDLLFKISNVEIDNINSNNYYKIDFKFDSSDKIDDLEKQVVDNFTCIFDYVGSEAKSIIKDDDIEKLSKLADVYIDLMNSYYDKFFDDLSSCFVLYDFMRDEYLYDPYVMEFIIRNKLFINENSLNSYTFIQTVNLPKDFLRRYKQTIFYNFIDKRSFEVRFRKLRIQDRLSYFFKSGKRYYLMELFTDRDAKDLYRGRETFFTYDYNGNNVLFNTILKFLNIDNSNLQEEEYEFEEPGFNIENSINCELIYYSNKDGINCELELDIPYNKELYLDCDLDLIIPTSKLPCFLVLKKVDHYVPPVPDKKESLEDYIINNFKDYYCENNLDDFTCVPIVLFIIKTIMNNITINKIN